MLDKHEQFVLLLFSRTRFRKGLDVNVHRQVLVFQVIGFPDTFTVIKKQKKSH